MTESVLSADYFHDEAAALAYIEARIWPNGPVCPRCGERSRVGRLNGQTTRLGMCKCYVCRKPFMVTAGTFMESSHIPLHIWLQAMHLMCTSRRGISCNQLHLTLGVTVKSAWFLTNRIHEALQPMRDEKWAAIVLARTRIFSHYLPGRRRALTRPVGLSPLRRRRSRAGDTARADTGGTKDANP